MFSPLALQEDVDAPLLLYEQNNMGTLLGVKKENDQLTKGFHRCEKISLFDLFRLNSDNTKER